MNPKDIHIGSSPEAVAGLITNRILALARASKSPLRVALSGGSTPETLFACWRKRPERELQNLGISFWQVDERLVPQESKDSNWGNALRGYFAPAGYPASLLHPVRFDPLLTREEIAEAYDRELRDAISLNPGLPPFDLVLLGVGEDGHTSSLFPGQDLFDREDYYIPSVHPVNGTRRVALSYRGILQSAHLIFHVLGEKKRDILRRVLSPENATDAALPAARIISLAPAAELFTDIEL